jgi:hypothetical protein
MRVGPSWADEHPPDSASVAAAASTVVVIVRYFVNIGFPLFLIGS